MEPGLLHVEVVYSPRAGELLSVSLLLPPGTSVREAAQAAGWEGVAAALDADALTLGVWGRTVPPGDHVQDGDRVEVLRPLQVDPKEARHRRHQAQLREGKRAEPQQTGQASRTARSGRRAP